MKKTSTALALIFALFLSLTGLGGAPALAAGQTTVHAANNAELAAAIENLQSNTIIQLDGSEYNADFWLNGLENITIQGTGATRIVTNNGDDVVMSFWNCKNITLSGLVIGHDVPQEEGCSSGVINAGDSTLTVVNCDIFGCGNDGIEAYGGTLTVKDSTIRDCSSLIVYLGGPVTASFQNCVFSGNAYKRQEYIAQGYGGDMPAVITSPYSGDVNVSFDSCTFKNNQNIYFTSEGEDYDEGKTNLTVTNCLFENNGWSTPSTNGTGATAAAPSTPSQPSTPSTPAQPAGITATPTAASVLVNGVNTAFDAYSIDGNNYFKLRDLAYVLNGTPKQFEVSWDNAAKAINLIPGQAYTAAGGEMTAGTAGAKSAAPTDAKILFNGIEVSLTAYNIGGNNYFKLRDVGQIFNFGVGWDNASKTITIDTSTGYTA